MSSFEIIMQHIPKLTLSEMDRVLRALLTRKREKSPVMKTLQKYVGRGKGTWEDPQSYIKSLREDDRF